MKTKSSTGSRWAGAALLAWVGLACAVLPGATAQTPAGAPPAPEQAIQNNTRMLNSVRANPQTKAQALNRLNERMTSRGLTDIDARLAEIGKTFDEALAMTPADFEKNQQQLAARIMAQLRGADAGSASGAGITTPRAQGAVASPTNTMTWIDVHNHLIPGEGRDFSGAFSAALAVMDQIGISKMIVMYPPHDSQRDNYQALAAALPPSSARFAALGGGESLNVMIQQARNQTAVSESLKRQFEQTAGELLRQGAAGFGEIAAHHLSLHGEDHPYESVPADHPLLLLLADIAARHEVPIDIHFDVVTNDIPIPDWLKLPNNPKVLHANLAGFEHLLDHNPKAHICWAHAGSDNIGHWTVELSRRLLEKHPNLYMSLRLGPGKVPQNFPLSRDKQIKPEWLKLLQDYPDRFMIGSDNFIAAASFRGSGTAAALAQRVPLTREWTPLFLKTLPPDLARQIATENASAQYKLKR